MKTIAIISPVGGAGRTTLTAALAGLLTARKHPVLALECDPRNVLALYCGLREPARAGLASYLLDGAAARDDAALQSDDGTLWLPWGGAHDLGTLSAGDQAKIDDTLHQQPQRLRDLIAQVELPAHGMALIDSATWPSVHAEQAIAAADLALVVLPPTPAACATLPRLRARLMSQRKPSLYVANAVSPAMQLHTDILSLLRQVLGAELSSYRIHADSGIPEALARNESFSVAAPHSQAAHDMQGLATWLSHWTRQATRPATAATGGAP